MATPAAVRMRRTPARQRAGRRCYTFEGDTVAIEDFLVRKGWLTSIEPEALEVEAAIAAFIDHVTSGGCA